MGGRLTATGMHAVELLGDMIFQQVPIIDSEDENVELPSRNWPGPARRVIDSALSPSAVQQDVVSVRGERRKEIEARERRSGRGRRTWR